jgi:threonine aldolase
MIHMNDFLPKAGRRTTFRTYVRTSASKSKQLKWILGLAISRIHLNSLMSGEIVRLQLAFGSNHNEPSFVATEIMQVLPERDVYGQGEALQAFEKEVAMLLDMPSALFCPSGTMAQQIALAMHCYGAMPPLGCNKPKPILIAHATSHLLLHEFDAVQHLLGFRVCTAGDPARVLNAEDVEKALLEARSMQTDGHREGEAISPIVIIVELPHREIGGATPTISDLSAIKSLAADYGASLHCDGARLLEVAPFYEQEETDALAAVGFPQLSSLQVLAKFFDSCFLSFYKGVGAVTGSMLLGSETFISGSKIWRKRYGGGLYAMWPLAAHCQLKLKALPGEGAGTHAGGIREAAFTQRYRRLCALVTALNTLEEAEAEAEHFIRFVPPKPQSSMVHVHVKAPSREALEHARTSAAEASGISVFERLRVVDPEPGYFAFEWSMGPVNTQISDESVLRGWKALIEALKAGR